MRRKSCDAVCFNMLPEKIGFTSGGWKRHRYGRLGDLWPGGEERPSEEPHRRSLRGPVLAASVCPDSQVTHGVHSQQSSLNKYWTVSTPSKTNQIYSCSGWRLTITVSKRVWNIFCVLLDGGRKEKRAWIIRILINWVLPTRTRTSRAVALWRSHSDTRWPLGGVTTRGGFSVSMSDGCYPLLASLLNCDTRLAPMNPTNQMLSLDENGRSFINKIKKNISWYDMKRYVI